MAVGLGYLLGTQQANLFHPTGADRPWALPGFQYFDGGPDSVMITGTLKGEHVGYRSNTWEIHCFKSDSVCRVANVQQIGRDQLGAITMFDWPIQVWSDSTIVAIDDPSPLDSSCQRSTITVNREAKTVRYTGVSINSDKSYCNNKMIHPEPLKDWEIGMPVQPWEKGRK